MNVIDHKDKVGSGLLLIFSVCYLAATWNIPLNPILGEDYFTARTLPRGLAVIAIVMCIVQLSLPTNANNQNSIRATIRGFRWKPFLLLTGLMLAYGLAFEFLGFVLATVLFLVLGFLFLGEKRIALNVTVSIAIAVFMWLVLTQLFGVYIDTGSFYRLILEG